VEVSDGQASVCAFEAVGCMISVSCCGVNEILVLLRCYAHRLVVSYRYFRAAYWPHLQGKAGQEKLLLDPRRWDRLAVLERN